MKSPIRLKEKRFNSAGTLRKLITPGSIVDSFLFFTGELESELLKDDTFLVVHTDSYVIYEFWRCIMESPEQVADAVEHLQNLIKEQKMFHFIQEEWPKFKGPLARSALFFLLNYHSSTGKISSGVYQERALSLLALSRLRNFSSEKFHISFDGPDDFLLGVKKAEKADFLFFPIGDFSFNILEEGHSLGFEETRIHHKHVKRFFNETDKKCILNYFKHSELFKLYEDHNIIMLDQYGVKTNDKKKCKEMLITNF
jgi:site-specific DNA-adenine methylase